MKNKTPTVRINILANFAGKIWNGVFSLAFIPIYVSIMGVEVYGLLGINISLVAILGLLDLGLGTTLGRELSRLSAIEGSDQEARNLVRTFEVIYWSIGLLSGLSVVFLAPLIAQYWISSMTIEIATVEQSLMIMGLIMAFQWPSSIYSGGLRAIQHQVAQNLIRSIAITLKHVGAVIILLFISPSVIGFFLWHAFVALLRTLVLSRWLWKLLPKTGFKGKFDGRLLIKNWKFTSGVFGISVVTLILTQADKIILSKMLSLEMFGYYMLALSVADATHGLAQPIITALFPRYTQLVTTSEQSHLIELYHKGSQFLSVIIAPMVVAIALFSNIILMLWLRDEVIVENTGKILSLLIIGYGIGALVYPPYMMQLAHAWTKLSFYKNIIAIICIVPLTIWLTNMYQGIGAAWACIVLNLGYLLIEIPIMHRRILKTEMWNWYLLDILLPAGTTFIIGYGSYLTMPSGLSTFWSFSWVLATYLISMLIVVLQLPHTRKDFIHYGELALAKIKLK
jgi:O-antigen/teichoic acid export membrane protein